MKRLTYLVLILLLLGTTNHQATAQATDLTIRYTAKGALLMNDLSLDSATTVTQLIKTIGEPSQKKAYPSGELSYFYEKKGVVFFTKDNLVKGLGVNFNWDGDNKFPEQTYSGKLLLGELAVDKQTTSQQIAAIKSIGFICPIPMMCSSKDREANIRCTAAFKEGQLTQLAFIIK